MLINLGPLRVNLGFLFLILGLGCSSVQRKGLAWAVPPGRCGTLGKLLLIFFKELNMSNERKQTGPLVALQ